MRVEDERWRVGMMMRYMSGEKEQDQEEKE